MTDPKRWFSEQLETYRDDPEFLTEELIIEINEQICNLMDQRGLNRSQLAAQLGVSRQMVTKILRGNPNVTLLTLMKIAVALKGQLEVRMFSKEDVKIKPWAASELYLASNVEKLHAFPSAA